MSVQAGAPWEYAGLKFWGLSLSGIRTCLAMPELSLAFDVAQGYPFSQNLKKYFLTHGHLDHSAGVPYIISQKAMLNQAPGHFYMPKSIVDPLDRIMKIWMELEKHEYQYHFHGLQADDEVEINPSYFIKAFPTMHRVDSLGFSLFGRNKKLKPEFKDQTQKQLTDLRAKGVEIQESIETPLVSFSGDSQIEFLDSRPWIKKSKILFVESTYVDERKTIEHARKWGHTHIDELVPRLDEIESERIVLIHISSRYSMSEAQKLVTARVPKKHHERIVLLPGR